MSLPLLKTQSRKIWKLSSTQEQPRGHLSLEITLLYRRLAKFEIKSQKIL
ncbi:hypothetical protein ES319_A07G132000v1 [Gossypium barbadense]|uniref:Uncharacterized protein n=2 Tax=Gossypium TaxID=3633 RepID=A0A5J5V3N3_GOSBA|nr:hypothetical protein ES319_A07G132000v1 [Gossypium barbadense]TYH09977.1 hypothetical protein ES288_A07G141000v1 [Gossypium darwinii]